MRGCCFVLDKGRSGRTFRFYTRYSICICDGACNGGPGRWGRRWDRRFRRVTFPEQAAGDPQRAFGLLNINGLGQNQVGADPEGFGNPSLAFDDGNGKRGLIGSGIVRTLKQKGSILLVIAVHHDGIEVFRHQFFHRRERLVAGLNPKLQVAQNLRDHASGFLIRAE
jgi:hypothetical protein